MYDSRASKLNELMDKTDMSIQDVVADKIYTSAEFKKVKEVFSVGIILYTCFSMYSSEMWNAWSNAVEFVFGKETVFQKSIKVFAVRAQFGRV